jgi:hypothetical protein
MTIAHGVSPWRDPNGLGSLDFDPVPRNLMSVAVARSRFFACLAFLLWATVGVLAVEHCACDDVSSACEHAGEVCAQPDDCSDCLVPSSPTDLVDEPSALLPSAKVSLDAPLLATRFAYLERHALAPFRPIFSSTPLAYHPPALRAGTMCLRI